MSVHCEDNLVTLHHGDCLDVLRSLPDNSVDSVVTDPPYGLSNTTPAQVAETLTKWMAGDRDYLPGGAGFMGKAWDAFVPPVAVWDEAFRVLKPGGHLLAFAGSRTFDLMGLSIRLAGFDIRDSVAWLYGSGFPKSLDVSKAIDKLDAADERRARALTFTAWMRTTGLTSAQINDATGTNMGGHYLTDAAQPAVAVADLFDKLRPLLPEVPAVIEALVAQRTVESANYAARGVVTELTGHHSGSLSGATVRVLNHGTPATDDARRWQGWGTAMKPAHEPVVHGVKPYALSDVLAGIGSHLTTLEKVCESTAKPATPSSTPSRAGSPAASLGSAPASAATPPEVEPARTTPTGEAAGSSEATATSASESTAATFSNTVTSWRASWAAICEATSRSTTGTTTRPTTDLTTLSSCLSQITRDSTAWSTTGQGPSPSLVEAADCLFAASVLSSRSTLALSATESATSATQPTSPAEGAGSTSRYEPVVVARKPLASGTVAANVLAWGTGALNIDGCRIDANGETWAGNEANAHGNYSGEVLGKFARQYAKPSNPAGRWPANVVLDEDAAAELDRQSGTTTSPKPYVRSATADSGIYGAGRGTRREGHEQDGHGDTGGASRFFYVAKAPTRERPTADDGTRHPTVKPLALMRWLVRLVTPPGGVVLEPFAGSGTTVEACLLEGFRVVAIERETTYLPLIEQRIRRVMATPPEPPAAATLFDDEAERPKGRWPANVILDRVAAAELDAQSGNRPGFSGGGATPGEVGNDVYGKGWRRNPEPTTYGDSGGASRFFTVVDGDEPTLFDEDGAA